MNEHTWLTEKNFEYSNFEQYRTILCRGGWGAWCGYVEIPPGHPWASREQGDFPVDVHGGITWDEKYLPEPVAYACSIIGISPSKPGSRWIGFDCSHPGDFLPFSDGTLGRTGKYMTLEQARHSIKLLANEVYKSGRAMCARCRVKPVDETLGVPGCRDCANEVMREEFESQPAPRAKQESAENPEG